MAAEPKVLIIDDDIDVGNFFHFLLSSRNYNITKTHTGREGLAALHEDRFDLAMVDLKLPDFDGLNLLREIKRIQPGCPVIIMTGYSTTQSAVEAIKIGAFDYIEKPFDNLTLLENLIDEALSINKSSAKGPSVEAWTKTVAGLGYLVGKDPKMLELLSLAAKIARKNINILIQGETGTGKEMLSRFLHSSSPRSSYPFLAVNCGALSETLLESELFGHEKGSFTGANNQRRGIFELAHNGTLFLDEIGEAGLPIQVKLLRVLETGEFLRVGGEKICRTDVRVIAATNVDLEKEARENRFRLDLFYRLDAFKLVIPPLRERNADIPLFAEYFLERQGTGKNSLNLQFAPETMEIFKEYPWPGNVRELANVVAQTAAICDDGIIKPKQLPAKFFTTNKFFPQQSGGLETPAPSTSRYEPIPVLAASKLPRDSLDALPSKGSSSKQEICSEVETLINNFVLELVSKIDVSSGFNLPEFQERLKETNVLISSGLIKKALRETLGNRKEVCKLLNTNTRVLRYILNEKQVKKAE